MQPVEKLFQLLNLGFLFTEPFVWSGKAKYSAEELKELPLSDVLLMSDFHLLEKKNRPRNICYSS